MVLGSGVRNEQSGGAWREQESSAGIRGGGSADGGHEGAKRALMRPRSRLERLERGIQAAIWTAASPSIPAMSVRLATVEAIRSWKSVFARPK